MVCIYYGENSLRNLFDRTESIDFDAFFGKSRIFETLEISRKCFLKECFPIELMFISFSIEGSGKSDIYRHIKQKNEISKTVFYDRFVDLPYCFDSHIFCISLIGQRRPK